MWLFFFQAEDGIRDLVRSRGLGDVYKRQVSSLAENLLQKAGLATFKHNIMPINKQANRENNVCLLYTSDAADERSSVDLGGRRIIKKKKTRTTRDTRAQQPQKTKHTHKHYTPDHNHNMQIKPLTK